MRLRALARIIQHQWYSNQSVKLKTPQGIFDWFITCLLDQSVNPEHHFRTVNGLRKGGWLDYDYLKSVLDKDRAKLEAGLQEALKSYRFPNRATKAILTNLEKIGKEYMQAIFTTSILLRKKNLESSQGWTQLA